MLPASEWLRYRCFNYAAPLWAFCPILLQRICLIKGTITITLLIWTARFLRLLYSCYLVTFEVLIRELSYLSFRCWRIPVPACSNLNIELPSQTIMCSKDWLIEWYTYKSREQNTSCLSSRLKAIILPCLCVYLSFLFKSSEMSPLRTISSGNPSFSGSLLVASSI